MSTRLHRLYKNRLAQRDITPEEYADLDDLEANVVLDKESAQNVVDEPELLAKEEYSHQTNFPTEQDRQDQSGFPEIDFGVMREVEGNMAVVKMADALGKTLTDLVTPSTGSGFNDNPADNHQSENDFEDPDLKLGEVEAPYSSADGPESTRFEDDHTQNILRGADADQELVEMDIDAVALIDSGGVDDSYTDAIYTRQDRSIPRDPERSKMIYGK